MGGKWEFKQKLKLPKPNAMVKSAFIARCTQTMGTLTCASANLERFFTIRLHVCGANGEWRFS